MKREEFSFFSELSFWLKEGTQLAKRALIFDKCLIQIYIGTKTNKRNLSSPHHVSGIEINPGKMVSFFLMLIFSVF